MFNAAVFAAKECDKVQSCQENQHTSCLQRKIQQYFNGDDDVDVPNQMGQNRLKCLIYKYTIHSELIVGARLLGLQNK